jgi:serine protease Do
MQPVSLPKELASTLKIDQETALMIMQVEPGSPASEAGLTLGDMLISMNDQPVNGIDDIQRALGAAKRGDSVQLGYIRGGKSASAKVKLAERPRG